MAIIFHCSNLDFFFATTKKITRKATHYAPFNAPTYKFQILFLVFQKNHIYLQSIQFCSYANFIQTYKNLSC